MKKETLVKYSEILGKITGKLIAVELVTLAWAQVAPHFNAPEFNFLEVLCLLYIAHQLRKF